MCWGSQVAVISFFFYSFIYLFIYSWLCWAFASVRGLSLAAVTRGHSSSRCAGLPLSRPLLLQSRGSRHSGSVVVAHGPSCSVACGILPDQGSNLCPMHQQADSQPLHHEGSPRNCFLETFLLPYLYLFYACFIGFNFFNIYYFQSFRKLNLLFPLYYCQIQFKYSKFKKWVKKAI